MTVTDMRAGEQLGAFTAQFASADLPADVQQKVRTNLLHDFSCAMAAHAVGEPLWSIVRAEAAGDATVLCDGARLGSEHAAFANGSLFHARAQDDTHFAAKTHVGAVVIPAALALAEERGADGATFARAVVVGCEVAAAVGERLAAKTTPRGFRATPVFGTLGAAAAASVILGLDAAQASDAIAIASSFSGGLNQTWIDGSAEYRLHIGQAARNGITAAKMAAGGLHGAPAWYEGAAGFARAFGGEDGDPNPGTGWELGERWRIFDVNYKPYPVCAILQSAVQVTLDLTREHDLKVDDVAAIRTALNPADRLYPGTVNPGPYGDVGATLMSAEYTVAMALKHRDATLVGLTEFEDPDILRLVGLTEVVPDEGLPNQGGRVAIETTDGRTVEGAVIPEASTYGWDWDGTVANAKRMLPEMAVDAAKLDAQIEAITGVFELPSVKPLVQNTLTD